MLLNKSFFSAMDLNQRACGAFSLRLGTSMINENGYSTNGEHNLALMLENLTL